MDRPKTQTILERHQRAEHIVIEHYGEVFNSHAQNFRLQKQNPALILAEKQNRRVIATPAQYETGGGANYYFSHMLNCLYDCRYCFLQGMYRSANYLLFVNYEDFVTDIAAVAAEHKADKNPPWFFSGYDCDSLALEPVTGFAEYFLDAFANMPHAVLELRTKSTQVRSLLNRSAIDNAVVAFSLSPANVAESLEIGAPSLDKRLQAMQKLQGAGWRVGVRFDPVVWHQGWEASYAELVEQVFNVLDASTIDSISLGGFRLPKGYYKTMRKLYPEHWLFSAGLAESNGMVAYETEIEASMFETISNQIADHIATENLFVYYSNELTAENQSATAG